MGNALMEGMIFLVAIHCDSSYIFNLKTGSSLFSKIRIDLFDESSMKEI